MGFFDSFKKLASEFREDVARPAKKDFQENVGPKLSEAKRELGSVARAVVGRVKASFEEKLKARMALKSKRSAVREQEELRAYRLQVREGLMRPKRRGFGFPERL